MIKQLTKIQYEILCCLDDTDLFYPFSHFEVNLTRKELSKEFKILRKAGLVEFSNGLMTEDGEVCGSGYGRPYNSDDKLNELMTEYELNHKDKE